MCAQQPKLVYKNKHKLAINNISLREKLGNLMLVTILQVDSQTIIYI